MEPVDRQRDRVRKKLGFSEKRPDNELPVMDPFFSDDAEAEDRLDPGFEMAESIAGSPYPNGTVLFQKFFYPRIVLLRRINSIEDRTDVPGRN